MQTTLNTIVEFISDDKPQTISNTITDASVNTGNNIFLILFILAAIFISIPIFIKIYCCANSKTTNTYKKINFLCIVFSTLILCFSIFSLAFANDITANITTPNVIHAHVDKETGTITVEDSYININNETNITLNKVETKSLTEQSKDLGKWCLQTENTILYNNIIPGSNLTNYQIEKNINLKYSVNNISKETAISLIGTKAIEFDFTFNSKLNYEIYPIPQKIDYSNETFDLNKKINIVSDKQIDNTTINKLKKILNKKSIKYEFSNNVKTDMHNIILSINSGLQGKYDAHDIIIDSNSIKITGINNNAVFIALSTIDFIFEQSQNYIQGLTIHDYADSRLRGIIEGFYGIPWSEENRKDLMEYASKFKMNSYIFAPKDDIYHSTKWKEAYPATELNKIKQLVDKGLETKINFTWNIHPFMENPIQFDEINYPKDLKCITDKFEQLYSIGVRDFGLSADDITKYKIKAEDQLRLINDLNNWCLAKHDCGNLVFVPQYYHQKSAKSAEGQSYYQIIKKAPETVDIMWTGNDWIGHSYSSSFDYFKNITGREPYMWFNWPVNDYIKDWHPSFTHILLGKAEMLIEGTTNYIGLVTNPMQQAQASKIGILSVAQYCWNNAKFNRDKVWKDSFKYAEEANPEALSKISEHLCYSTNQCEMDFQESENIKTFIEEIKTAINEDRQISEKSKSILLNSYEEILANINSYTNKHSNNELYKELKPFLDCFVLELNSSINALNSIEKYQNKYTEGAKVLYNKAKDEFRKSELVEVPTLPDANKVYAETGCKRIKPLLQDMLKYLESKLGQ